MDDIEWVTIKNQKWNVINSSASVMFLCACNVRLVSEYALAGWVYPAHDNIRSGLHWLGLPWNARFWDHNANATFLVEASEATDSIYCHWTSAFFL